MSRNILFVKKLPTVALLLTSLFVTTSFSFIDEKKGNPINPPSACFMENTTFQHGEEITYKLYYNVNFVWMAAGEVTFTVEDLGNQWHLRAIGKTYSSYEWFFKVNDRYDTYLDKNSLLPVVSIREISEGKYKLYDKVVFDQSTHKAHSYRGKYAADAKKKDLDLTNCMHDLVSTIYYCRNIDFANQEKNTTFPLRFLLDEKEYPINVKFKGKNAKTSLKDMGSYKTIKFSPQVIDGRVFKEGTELNVWASDDKNKIPLMIESPLSVGSVKVVLKSYKGLRYPFEAKVN